jgi:acyl transferase domain-containing protein/thioesterase domain-containing protein/NADP-dependent 3-hydroxy acid dehydrogenase YdfG/acyl carrier protein
MGHTSAAAGVAGVIKMVMAMRHGVMPRTLHVDEPSPHVDWSEGDVELLREARSWESDDDSGLRRAGISSFGVSGTNAHVIVEEAPPPRRKAAAKGGSPGTVTEGAALAGSGVLPFVVSGSCEEALEGQASRLAAWLRARPELDLREVAAALVLRRARLGRRAVVVSPDRDGLLSGLDALCRGESVDSLVGGRSVDRRGGGKVAFLFSGQGSQWPGMGSELYGAFPLFAEALNEVCAGFDSHLPQPLKGLLFAKEGSDEAALLDRTQFTQPALFALEVALYRLIASFGVVPDYLIGHSIGELSAAHVAGVFSLEDAVALVAARGRLMGGLPAGGAMLAVRASEEDAREGLSAQALDGRVSVAAVNGPRAVVLSGDEEAIQQLDVGWRERGHKTTRLRVSHAFHSRLMAPMLDELREVAEGLRFSEPRIPIVSNVTGSLLSAGDAVSPEYWVDHVRDTVRFADGVACLSDVGVTRFLEVGPDRTLGALVTGCVENGAEDPDVDGDGVFVAASMRPRAAQAETFLVALAGAYVRDLDVDWGVLFGGVDIGPVELPTYAFQRKRYWLEAGAGVGDLVAAGQSSAEHPLLRASVPLAGGSDGDGGWLFTGRLSLQSHPWIADHAVAGTVLLPGTGFVEILLRAGREVGCDQIAELTLEFPLVFDEERGVQLQVSVEEPDEEGRRTAHIYSRADGGSIGDDEQVWVCNASGLLEPGDTTPVDQQAAFARGEWPPPGAESVEVERLYEDLAERGYDYGPVFQGLKAAWRCGEEMFVEVALPEDQRTQAALFELHPALLDSTFHALIVSLVANDGSRPVLPFSWNNVRLYAAGASALRARITTGGEETMSLVVTDDTGEMVASVGALVGREVSTEQLASANLAGRASLFRSEWMQVSPSSPVDRWAVLGEDGGALEQSLRAAGKGAERQTDIEALIGAVEAGSPAPGCVLVDFRGGGAATAGSELAHDAHAALHRALALMQAWLSADLMSASRLVFVTEGAVAAQSGEGVSGLDVAALWGLVRSAQSEQPGRFVLVDLDQAASSFSALGGALGADESQLALREGTILAPRLKRVAIDAQDKTEGDHFVLDRNGTALITGGTGGLGGAIARHLVVEHGVSSVVLTSRRGREADGASELEQELAGLGARVQIAACDVADRDQVKTLIDSVPEEHPLVAVVHAAAVFDNGLITELTPEQVDRVLAPKLDAALHLHELTAHLNLQAFALFSSIAGTFGGPGQGNYAAGNVFLDALAEHRREQGLVATSMAWPPWNDIGMGRFLDEAAIRRVSGSASLGSLSPAEGLELFDAALASGEAMVVPARIDLGVLRAEAKSGALPRMLSALVRVRVSSSKSRGGAKGSLARRLSDVSKDEREHLLLEEIRAHVAVVLGHESSDEIPPERKFLELGFDSLAAVELRNRLNTVTGLRMPVTIAFDYPTSAELASYVGAELEPVVERREDLSHPTEARAAHAPIGGESTSTISALFRQAHSLGKMSEYLDMLATASQFYPTFDIRLGPDEAPEAVRLSKGVSRLGLLCFPSLIATAGPHQYAKFARAFHGNRDLSVLPNPGFIQGEPIPGTFQVAVETQAEAVRRQTAGSPVVLAGHSTGGLLAYAVAAELERLGSGPAAVVLIDTYTSSNLPNVMPQVLDGMFERGQTYKSPDDAGLIAMAAYGRLFAEWEPQKIASPIMLVRAAEPMAGQVSGEWRSSWHSTQASVEVPGNHFSMMEEHVEKTALAVQEWLVGLDGDDRPVSQLALSRPGL